MKVVETIVTHGYGALYFVDAAVGDFASAESLLGLDERPQVTFSPAVRGLLTTPKIGALALSFEEGQTLARTETLSIPDLPSPPARSALTLSGVVAGQSRRWLARAFAVTVSRGQRATLGLFRSPAGTQIGDGGALVARLGTDTGRPAPWCILTLSVQIPPETTLVCRAQSDAHGDVVLPLRRVPPLPKGVADYAATLAVRWNPSATAELPVDPESFVAGQLVPPDDATAQPSVSLRVAPGQIGRLLSLNNNQQQLIVRP